MVREKSEQGGGLVPDTVGWDHFPKMEKGNVIGSIFLEALPTS